MIAKSGSVRLEQLLEMYERGMLSVHESAWDCLLLIDPRNPEGVLSRLPINLIKKIYEVSDDYDPTDMVTWCIHMTIDRNTPSDMTTENPTIEQVAAARNWIEQHGHS